VPDASTNDRTLSPGEAAVLLSRPDDPAGARLRRAVDASLARHGIRGADRDDARAEVALALLTAPRRSRLELAAACALAARIARNKAVDQQRRRRRESLADPAPELELVPVPVEGRLAHDLDAVSGEAHRRSVHAALVELVGELPAPEREALRAAASGGGAGASGLARSSHYRALERARLRLAERLRARIAGGLALPFALARTLGLDRGGSLIRTVIGPVAALATAGIASVALVLPATEAARAPSVTHVAPVLRPAPSVTRTVPLVVTRRHAAPATRAPLLRVSSRHGSTAAVPAAQHAAPARRATTRHAGARPHAVAPAATPIESTPDAGLAPCKAAQLCS
jgi:DNA-directed RNA polymerase specialized sigma24 family protein